MQGTEAFEVASFLGTWNDKRFFKVQCRDSLEFFTMEVVSKQSSAAMQFGTSAEPLPNWGLPFCMELRYVFETLNKRYYVLDPAGEANLADLMKDGLPEPTVLIIAAELALALESLHELGVSYNELDLDHVTVDNDGHVALWREFEGEEYWHISECICGILDGNCEKIGHKIKRRGTSLQPGQRAWEEILLGAQDDWKSLGVLLCQLLTGYVGFENFQSLEQAIITLFITPTTKDFLYSLISGALQSFEDLRCHPCFDGLDWDEVKSKSFPSPLMANFRSPLHSSPSRSFSKSPSLQNVYTAGISARQERGVFANSSLSRTRSTSELHSNLSGRARALSLSAFHRSASQRRSTLCVPYAGSGHHDKGTSIVMSQTGNRNTQNFGHPRIGGKTQVQLHRQVFERNPQNFDRPHCVSAPSSPRQSVETGLNYVYPTPHSAPSSPRGSDGALHSENSPRSQSPATSGVFFNHPETNPFHEGYQKRWGSATIDTAYGIYSSHLKPSNENNNNTTIPGNSRGMADINQLKNNSANDNYSATGSNDRTCYGQPGSIQPNTYATANIVYSPVLKQNSERVIPERAAIFTTSDQARSYAAEVTQRGPQTRHYSMDGTNNNMISNYSPRNSPNNTRTAQSYDSPVMTVPSSNHHQEHLSHHRRASGNLATTNAIGYLQSQNANDVLSGDGLSQPSNPLGLCNDGQVQKRRESINSEISDGKNSSFFQTSSNDHSLRTEQNTPKETANILFQKYFRSRRDSVDSRTSGKTSPNSGISENNLTPNVSRAQSQFIQNAREMPTAISRSSPSRQLPSESVERKTQHEQAKLVEGYSDFRYSPRDEVRNNLNESTQPRGVANSFTRQPVEEIRLGRDTSISTTANNLTAPNTAFQKRNSRSPEPVVAIHPSIITPSETSVQITSDAEEFNRFQEQSQRRRSSSDAVSSSSLPISTSKSETSNSKPSLSRSQSYSNMGKNFGATKNDRTNAGQMNNRRSTTLRPIPSFEEFRMMRALSKMADDEKNDGNSLQKSGNNSSGKSKKENDDCYSERGQHIGDKSSNNNFASTTTASHTNNVVIQDLLAKYGLDKNPRSSSAVKPHQSPSNGLDNRESSSPTPPNEALRTTTSDPIDTKQRLLNILDDFLAVRTKRKTLGTSFSMYDIKAADSSRHRRLSLGEENPLNTSRDCSKLECKTLNQKQTTGSPNSESNGCELTSERADRKPGSPTLVISSPNSKSHEDMNSLANQSKTQSNSKGSDRKTSSERSRRKSKRTSYKQGSTSDVKESENRDISREETMAKSSVEKADNNVHQSDESVVSSTAVVDTRERDGCRRVSEKARNMARKHRESLELVKKSGKKARKERRRSFTQAMQSRNKESTSEQNENGEKQPVLKCAPVKGDHSVEVASESAEQKDIKYLRLKNRRTSSLLSLTDDLSGNLDGFDGGDDAFLSRHESLTEFKESNSDQEISRGDSFLSVDTDYLRRPHASRTESSSSLLSRHSSFHSNFSADSGSVQLDFEDSDDELFYLAEPRETEQKSETEIQRNDSGLGDEIGVGTRTTNRWKDLGHASSRQSMIVASWRELCAGREARVEEEQEVVKAEGHEEEQQQRKQERKVSRDRRISRQREPNAIDCPDCGRPFVVENDKPSVKSQGPKQTLICYKCQSHRVERKEAIVELVHTEMNYGNDFQIIKEEFLSPMQTGGIISPDNLAKIFLNIQELLDVSTKFCKKIQSSMEECKNKNDEELCHMNIGKIFVENVELLQAYELYCSRQPEAMTLLESLQKKNEVLRVFLNITCRENPKCRKMDINSFLMAPVQRVTKYPLLLSRIRRATPRWHDDREDLKSAQRKVEEQIAKINSLTKSSEMKAKKFQSNLGASDAVDSSRLKKLASDVLAWTLDEMQLLMHGQLKVLCSEFGGGQSWTKRAMKRNIETHLLFCIRGQNEPIKVDSEDDEDCLHFPDASEISDASLLLLKRKSNGKYTLFRDEVRLRDCVVYHETEPDSFGLIHMGKESFLFTASTSKDARKWIKYLKVQTKDQGKWRRRRNASANIMLKTS